MTEARLVLDAKDIVGESQHHGLDRRRALHHRRYAQEHSLFLYQFDYDGASGGIGNRRTFAEALDRGFPDGSTRDREGDIYNARVGGGAIACFAGDGALRRYLDPPCLLPTSCAFGGASLSTLHVTSARFGMSASDLALRPQEGGLWAIVPGPRGRPSRKFAG
jgi:sugar lactone lactonase YvrE